MRTTGVVGTTGTALTTGSVATTRKPRPRRWWNPATWGADADGDGAGGTLAGERERVPLRSRAGGGRVSRGLPTGAGAWEGATEAYPPGGLETLDRMRRDAQVRACLTTKRLAVLSEEATVHPGDGSEEARRASETVGRILREIPGGVAGIVSGALDALTFGYAVGEIVWTDDGTAEIVAVRWHDPRRFQFVADDFGTITGLLLRESGTVFPRERFLVYSYQSRFGNPYGESDLIAAYRPWATKDQLRRMWLSALDRFGAPIPVAKYPTNWQQADVDSLLSTLSKVQNESALAVPADVDIDIALDTGRVEPAQAFVTAIEYEDRQIARAILGQELTTQGGSGGSGSYALGKVHAGVAEDWVQSLRREIAGDVLTGQLARLLTLYHHPTAPTPTVSFPNLSPGEMAARRELVSALVAGEVVAPSEGWIRGFLGVPEIV